MVDVECAHDSESNPILIIDFALLGSSLSKHYESYSLFISYKVFFMDTLVQQLKSLNKHRDPIRASSTVLTAYEKLANAADVRFSIPWRNRYQASFSADSS